MKTTDNITVDTFTLVTAIKKVLYKLIVGHDGWTSGCGYDGSDVWNETFYGETPEEICEKLIKGNFIKVGKGQKYFRSQDANDVNITEYSKVEILMYDNQNLHLTTLDIFSLDSHEKKYLDDLFDENIINNLKTKK